jgi:hypothetical protein
VNSIELLRNRASAVTATLHSLVDQAGDVDLLWHMGEVGLLLQLDR